MKAIQTMHPTKKLFTGFICAALLLCSGVAFADLDGRWLHVRVEEHPDERIAVNIPLSLVGAVLPMIDTPELSRGRLDARWEREHLNGIDLRELFEALRDAPDADFVTVRSRHEDVRVSKDRGFLIVRVDEDDENVRVRMPLEVLEAMLGDDDGELDLIAGLERLSRYDGEDLVTVESHDSLVRIWIDDDESGD